jgi:hypothetical protein
MAESAEVTRLGSTIEIAEATVRMGTLDWFVVDELGSPSSLG